MFRTIVLMLGIHQCTCQAVTSDEPLRALQPTPLAEADPEPAHPPPCGDTGSSPSVDVLPTPNTSQNVSCSNKTKVPLYTPLPPPRVASQYTHSQSHEGSRSDQVPRQPGDDWPITYHGGQIPEEKATPLWGLKGRQWAAPSNLTLDIAAALWTIHRFIDGDAKVRYVAADELGGNGSSIRLRNLREVPLAMEGTPFDPTPQQLGILDSVLVSTKLAQKDYALKKVAAVVQLLREGVDPTSSKPGLAARPARPTSLELPEGSDDAFDLLLRPSLSNATQQLANLGRANQSDTLRLELASSALDAMYDGFRGAPCKSK